ncbi:hypothetical protein P153DRAFT_379123 [Dothidotthia symphoricarpi CBS 119687]|uniref:Uncharacterized protein n=1 Tax=Dothidotthia symphoricarpi CBS 119687 TaxID=1392245 RepID=A0A6A5ZZ87_9PLEO|nr:uncharacterized protein P153DRAFT_379123 [Dothidotthia symphoricarpi CBS 119687]KAF2125052.1 hypothetical protein P153DRAFT_379123 [Dothidotthia symphoricarpi CBS 119687]
MSQHPHWRQYQSSKSTHSRSGSSGSYDTAPTEYSDRRPSLVHSETCHARIEGRHRDDFAPANDCNRYAVQPAHASVETYASTSEEDVGDDFDDVPEYEVPQYHLEPRSTVEAIPTTPRDFGDLFPTAKRISIRHDDATIDGNMNLRVDTQVEERNHKIQNYTLFHLRMKDLRTREFSLRRYCRESGREVCHSIRKYQKPPSEQRPILQRASTALASLVHKPESRPSTSAGLKRSDSGYESMQSGLDALGAEEFESHPKSVGYSKGRALMPTNTIKLEFSNYAHLDVKRRGTKSNKRYAFEYWGNDYSWKRIVKKEHDQEIVSYYLIRNDNEKEPLAHICPVRLSADEAREETARGGWIPPSYMRITDEEILCAESDISDVVIATGLMALADDCIKRRFHSKQSTQLHIPLLRNGSFMMNMEYVGPKRLIDEMFNRTGGSPKKHHSPYSESFIET